MVAQNPKVFQMRLIILLKLWPIFLLLSREKTKIGASFDILNNHVSGIKHDR